MKQLILKIIYKRLASVAKKVISKHNPTIIAITGSVGKTSTKEALVQVMKVKFGEEVRYTQGNLNAEIGIPLTILGYGELPSKKEWPLFLLKISKHLREKNYPKFLILEMGVEHPGDIDYFCTIAKPSISIITAATPAHLANFGSVKEMQKEKIKLADYTPGNKIFYNCDDSFLSNNIHCGVSYGIHNNKSMIKALNILVTPNGNTYQLKLNNEVVDINNKLVGEQMVYADIAAAGVAASLGVTPSEIARSLNKRKPYYGRMNVLRGKDNITIIDDTYNANPASVIAAAKTLSDINHTGRKILILGNMNELGEESDRIHTSTAQEIVGLKGIDLIYFVGPNAQKMKSATKHNDRVKQFSNRQEVEADANKLFSSNDLILIKASQNNNYFEELVKAMLDPSLDAKAVLVRQSKEWLKKK